MRHNDIGLMFYTDVGHQQPAARVSTPHTCRNFSQVAEWVNQNLNWEYTPRKMSMDLVSESVMEQCNLDLYLKL
jgi:hypothetical protein